MHHQHTATCKWAKYTLTFGGPTCLILYCTTDSSCSSEYFGLNELLFPKMDAFVCASAPDPTSEFFSQVWSSRLLGDKQCLFLLPQFFDENVSSCLVLAESWECWTGEEGNVSVRTEKSSSIKMHRAQTFSIVSQFSMIQGLCSLVSYTLSPYTSFNRVLSIWNERSELIMCCIASWLFHRHVFFM